MKKPYSDRRFYDLPVEREAYCNHCKHYYGYAKCEAFPEEIPTEKLYLYKEPDAKCLIECKNGMKFEPKE